MKESSFHQDVILGRLMNGLLHELRNPLNAIINAGQLLEEKGDQVALRDTLLPVIGRSSKRIWKLLDNLDLFQPENHSRPTDLHQLLEACLELVARDLRLVKYHPSGVKGVAWVDVDPHKLWLLLLSLLQESLACEPTELKLRSTCSNASAGPGFWELEFEHDGEVANEEAGTSRLLTWSRTLVQQMQGELVLTARQPQGMCIRLRLRSNEQDPLR